MSPVSSAISIHFQAVDLADSTVGEDLWQYRYTVSDYVFESDTGFSLFFDPSFYRTLQSPAALINADWDILVTQPNTLLFSDNGIYDALALIDSPSLTHTFNLTFIWLGTNSPSNQFFEVYDFSFNTTESGQTQLIKSIPEPSILWLFSIGVFLFFIFQKNPAQSPTFNVHREIL